jgi:hypothetical protein
MFLGHLPPQQVKHLFGTITRATILGSGVTRYLNLSGISELNGLRDTDDQETVPVPR